MGAALFQRNDLRLRVGASSLLPRQALEIGEHLLELRFREEPAIHHDRIDLPAVADVLERACFEQYEIRDLALFDSAQIFSFPRNRAGLSVAVCKAAMGERPAWTKSSSSSCRLNPGSGLGAASAFREASRWGPHTAGSEWVPWPRVSSLVGIST